jgi:hypothetical protein
VLAELKRLERKQPESVASERERRTDETVVH